MLGVKEENLSWVPLELRDLPENPAHLFDPIEIVVRCGSPENPDLHRIRWTPDGIELLNHKEVAEEVVHSLGGNESVCSMLKSRWGRDEPFLFSDLTGGHGGHSYIRNHISFVDPDDKRNIVNEFLWRQNESGASMYVATKAFNAWLEHNGIPAAKDNRAFVYVSDEHNTPDEILRGFFTMSSKGEFLPVFAYGVAHPNALTRYCLVISSEWYRHVRQNGFVINDNFSLGRNQDGPVVIHITPDQQQFFAVSADIVDAVPLSKNVFEFHGKYLQKDPSATFIGALANWEHNDEFYYRIEGSHPKTIHFSMEDAISWACVGNIKQFALDGWTAPDEYGESFDLETLPEDFDLKDSGVYDIMRVCVANAINPVFTIPEFFDVLAVVAPLD